MPSELDEQLTDSRALLKDIKRRQAILLESIRSNFIPDPTNAIDVEFKVIGDTPTTEEAGKTQEVSTSETSL